MSATQAGSTAVDLHGRTAIVTGAGAGLGQTEALRLAAQGAAVVVNDLGEGAETTARLITEAGGRALAVRGDISRWALGDELVEAAVDTFGALDIVVNNAGVIRDTMIFNLTEQDWDLVLDVHLKGHASLSRAAAVYFRAKSKVAGGPVYGRIINTTSEAGLMGAAGQPNYSAAKAGITALTLSTAQGLARYGVQVNAIAPRARTAMTEHVFSADADGGRLDILSPERVARLVAFLASPASAGISGQLFISYGDFVALLEPAQAEHVFTADDDLFTEEELARKLGGYFADRDPYATFAAYGLAKLDTTGVQPVGA
ncbi:MAG: SDR family NAD(P)-dependent oxidoreductase [Intrasporangium sp.]|uniref:SDR family NAD(P)-dependent oxidoreductase n=1 Tax=Intrasporangium sp. TaxID=1925024 RepID=UPI0026499C96|nr:SDR family NAD(P)-dependent oxidoreductase [Intrasporangium sp.]MDN5796927.1 SDR family NAD(P)-dependent oxidoreductase [Intrasporangium sp.]